MPPGPRAGDAAAALATLTPEQRKAYVGMQLSGPDFGYGVVQNPPEDDFLDWFGNLRYGMPTSQKEVLAISGALPGAPQDMTAEQTIANRYASGYLFGREHPTLASMVQPFVDMVKTSDLPFFGGSTPEEQSYASEGVRRGRGAPMPRLPAGSAAQALASSAIRR